MVSGLSHITLITRDLERMEKILVTVLDARKVYDSGQDTHSLSPERFFLVGPADAAIWIATMLGDVKLDRSYNHVAFKIDECELDDKLDAILSLGLDVRPPRPRIAGEAQSIYFYDDDNHLFELHTGTLDCRLQAYAHAAARR